MNQVYYPIKQKRQYYQIQWTVMKEDLIVS